MKYSNISTFVFQVSVNDSLRRQIITGDLAWCERVSSGVVQNMLRSCQTMYTQVHLLRLLCHSKFGIGFIVTGKCHLITTSVPLSDCTVFGLALMEIMFGKCCIYTYKMKAKLTFLIMN